MKKLVWLVMAAVFATTPVMASDDSRKDDAGKQMRMSFDEMKAERIKKIDARIQKLQEGKQCLEAATTPDEAKKCKTDNGREMKERMHRHDNQ